MKQADREIIVGAASVGAASGREDVCASAKLRGQRPLPQPRSHLTHGER
jgi:hypothetical protein